ncbi:mechanosensitive ion channel family protein [Pleomorphovibrio marinus]|uniref:mechanosensitive ion channel family protein n=1 Tax=Pleomorphovibrio marinus TaxID=2164132 RepID=UPI000E0AFE39|nr:mechanosensitive ion channel domain-containing protein [Pleomorphovibrio marinus]
MKSKKDQIEFGENKRRIIFGLKVLTYIALIFVSEAHLQRFPEKFHTQLYNLVSGLEFYLAGAIIVSLGRFALVRFYLRKKDQERIHSNFLLGINWIASIINVLIVLISLMIFFNIRPLEFLSSITIVAAAIALLSKDYITNMINGLIIMFSDQLTLGDHIKVGDFKGRIQDITLLNVVILNEDDDLVMIPNSLLLSAQVINHSRQNIRKLSFEFEIKLNERLDIDEIDKGIKALIHTLGNKINQNTYVLKATAILKDSVKLKLQVQLNTYERNAEKEVRRKINQKIIKLSSEIQ